MKVVHISFLLIGLLGIFSCGGESKEMSMDINESAETDATNLGTGNPGSEDITLTDMPPTEEFPTAEIEDWKYDNGTFNYTVGGGYTLGRQTDDAESVMCANSDKGQHIHLIIDNEPYIAQYTPTFDQPMADGDHYLLTFLSRSYHESIKTDQAHRAVMASVSNGSFGNPQPISDPMLFYSRPKGTYTGTKETENVMLDFYPVNAPLGSEYQVKASINGKEFMIEEWKPYFIEGLPMGENSVTLTLMKGDSVVQAPLNPVVRTFTLVADPTETATK